MSEDELRARFEALRTEDQQRTPGFSAVLSRRRPRTPSLWVLVPAFAVFATAAAVLFFDSLSAPLEDLRLVRVGLREPEPLAFLLTPVPALEESP